MKRCELVATPTPRPVRVSSASAVATCTRDRRRPRTRPFCDSVAVAVRQGQSPMQTRTTRTSRQQGSSSHWSRPVISFLLLSFCQLQCQKSKKSTTNLQDRQPFQPSNIIITTTFTVSGQFAASAAALQLFPSHQHVYPVHPILSLTLFPSKHRTTFSFLLFFNPPCFSSITHSLTHSPLSEMHRKIAPDDCVMHFI